jgi:hypothetical protein
MLALNGMEYPYFHKGTYPIRASAVSFSHISLKLTLPSGREYIPGVLKRGNSSAGAGIRAVPGKANSYPIS